MMSTVNAIFASDINVILEQSTVTVDMQKLEENMSDLNERNWQVRLIHISLNEPGRLDVKAAPDFESIQIG